VRVFGEALSRRQSSLAEDVEHHIEAGDVAGTLQSAAAEMD
jgi:hypothetical protein